MRVRSLEARSRMLLEQRRVPPHTVELVDLGIAHLTGELGWVRAATGADRERPLPVRRRAGVDGRTGRRAVVRPAGRNRVDGPLVNLE